MRGEGRRKKKKEGENGTAVPAALGVFPGAVKSGSRGLRRNKGEEKKKRRGGGRPCS